ncbi:MAG: hypothetical protein MJ246_02885 [Clostridia bacterium]|nr:hypothetical protein [Clostridia bacterium]
MKKTATFINPTGIICIYTKMTRIHLANTFSLQQILLFRDKLNAYFKDNEIPVRCDEITEENLYMFYECKRIDRDGNESIYNAYDPDSKVMDTRMYCDAPAVRRVIPDFLVPHNITKWCTMAYLESVMK